MKQTRIFLLGVILLQLTIIIYLATTIHYKNRNVLGTMQVYEIDKDAVFINTNSEFKNFYEPLPNTTQKINKSWLPTPVENTINEDTLNERFDYSLEKPKEVFRIITLGDSQTFGMFVNTKDNYPEQLEDILNSQLHCKNIEKFEVINLGVWGYDTQYEIERYKLRGQKYNPDLVIWFVKNNNFDRIIEKMIPNIKKYSKEYEKQNDDKELPLGGPNPLWEKAEEQLKENMNGKKLLQFQTKILYRMNNFYTGKLFIFIDPFLLDTYKKAVKDFSLSRDNMYFYDKIPDIWSEKKLLPDGHPSKEGYSILANNLAHQLLEKKIITCEQD